MFPDAKPLNDDQLQSLCRMIHAAFLEIRSLGATNTAQAAELADAFHNLPGGLWCSEFSLSLFRDSFLGTYRNKYTRTGGFFDYIAMVN